MKPTTTAILLLGLIAAPQAGATVLTLGLSNQNFTLTGLGAPAGLGQSRITWGSCTFDGTNTTCTVTGPFSGLGGGGTYKSVLTYAGNGPSPIIATSQTPGSDIINVSLSSGSLVTTLTEADGTVVNFYYTFFTFAFSNPTCTGVSNCSIGAVGNVAGATITGPFTGTFDATPMIRASQGVISAGQFGAFSAISPGDWIEIYGYNLATTLDHTWASSDFKGIQAPTSLAGTTVTIGGQPAFIDFVGPSQVNAQVPSGVDVKTQPVVVTTAGGSSIPTQVTVNTVEPGLLAPTVFKLPAGQYAAALFPDGITFVLPPGITNLVPTRRAKAGDVITFYGVGFGAVTPDQLAGLIVQQPEPLTQTFRMFFAGTPGTVQYAGLVTGYLGLYQFNVVVPDVAPSDTVPVTFSLAGVNGPQTLLLPIQ